MVSFKIEGRAWCGVQTQSLVDVINTPAIPFKIIGSLERLSQPHFKPTGMPVPIVTSLLLAYKISRQTLLSQTCNRHKTVVLPSVPTPVTLVIGFDRCPLQGRVRDRKQALYTKLRVIATHEFRSRIHHSRNPPPTYTHTAIQTLYEKNRKHALRVKRETVFFSKCVSLKKSKIQCELPVLQPKVIETITNETTSNTSKNY